MWCQVSLSIYLPLLDRQTDLNDEKTHDIHTNHTHEGRKILWFRENTKTDRMIKKWVNEKMFLLMKSCFILTNEWMNLSWNLSFFSLPHSLCRCCYRYLLSWKADQVIPESHAWFRHSISWWVWLSGFLLKRKTRICVSRGDHKMHAFLCVVSCHQSPLRRCWSFSQ
jgi:hypothetical protein